VPLLPSADAEWSKLLHEHQVASGSDGYGGAAASAASSSSAAAAAAASLSSSSSAASDAPGSSGRGAWWAQRLQQRWARAAVAGCEEVAAGGAHGEASVEASAVCVASLWEAMLCEPTHE